MTAYIKVTVWNFVVTALLMCVVNLNSERAWSEPSSTVYNEPSGIVGSVEGEIITNGEWIRARSDDPRRSQSLSPVWAARFAIDYPLNHYIWVGGELGLTWLSEPVQIEWQNDIARAELSGGRRLAAAPSARLRLDFPLACRWSLEGLFTGGVTRWGENRDSDSGAEDDVRWGVAWRVGLGLRYAINTQVQGVLNVAYSEQSVWSDDEITLSAYPVSFGLRGGF